MQFTARVMTTCRAHLATQNILPSQNIKIPEIKHPEAKFKRVRRVAKNDC